MRDLAVTALALAAGCYGPTAAVGVPCSSTGRCPSGQYCDTAQTPPTCSAGGQPDAAPVDAAPDAPPTCSGNADCDAAAPFCDLATMSCRGCQADSECGDDVCLESEGICHNASNTLFVSPGGSGSQCTRTSPCTFNIAMSQVANNQRVIAIADGAYGSAFTIGAFNANSLTLSGTDRDPTGAVVSSFSNAGLIVSPSMSDIIVEGITFANVLGDGIDNRGHLTLSRVEVRGNAQRGIVSTDGELTMLDSRIANHQGRGVSISRSVTEIRRCIIEQNQNGGIELAQAPFVIESSFIVNNGEPTNGMGGIRFQNIGSIQPQVFAFNTVAGNLSENAAANGVQCSSGLVLDSSILVDRISPNDCSATYSLFTSTPPAGTGNIMGTPGFIDEAARNYHVMPTSPVRDVANPAGTVVLDIDGEPRPLGAGRDIGADELP